MTPRTTGNLVIIVVAAVVLLVGVAAAATVLYWRPWSNPHASPLNAPARPPAGGTDSASSTPTAAPVRPTEPTAPPAAGSHEAAVATAADRQAAVREAERQAREGMPAPGGTLHGDERFDATLTVTEATGLTGVGPGTTCQLLFRYGETVNDLHCRALVDCGTHELYGAVEGRGFFACTAFSSSMRLAIGADPSSSAQDGDPKLTVDTARGTFTMSDDARGASGRFSLSGTVTVPPPPHPPGHGDGYGS